MSNLHNAYNSNFTFHGRNNTNYFSSGNQDYKQAPIHFSQIEKDEKDHIYNTTSKSIISEERNTRKKDSIPLMFVPPKIEATQINHNQKNPESDSEQIEEVNKELIQEETPENSGFQRKATNMLTRFSPMLSWSPSFPNNMTKYNDIEKFINALTESDTFDMNHSNEITEPIHQLDESSFLQDEVSSLIDEFSYMLDESASKLETEGMINIDLNEDDHTFLTADKVDLINNEEISQQIDESSVFQDSPIPIQTEDSDLEEHFLFKLTESSSEDEDISSLHIYSSPQLDEDDLFEESIEIPTVSEGYTELLEMAYSLLEESFDNDDSLQDEMVYEQFSTLQEVFSNILEEIQGSIADGTKPEKELSMKLNEISSLLYSFTNMLESANEMDNNNYEESSSLEESFLETGDPSILQNESSTSENYFEEHEESLNKHDTLFSDTIQGESESINKKSAELQDEFVRDLLHEESSIEDSFEIPQTHECIPKRHMPIVKLPVLVGKLTITIDIFDVFPLDLPINKITKLKWSLQSLDSHVVLPSNIVFLKGSLIADIEFTNQEPNGSIQTLKIPVPWEKTANVDWLYPPDMPVSRTQKDFMFSADNCEPSYHLESTQYFTEKIDSQLCSINYIWHNDLTKDENPQLQVQGRAKLEINLLQDQYVDLK